MEDRGGFEALRDRYVRFALERNPAILTFLGGDSLDPRLASVPGRLRDHRPAAVAEEVATYRDMQQELEGLDARLLSGADAIDASLLGAHLAFLVHQLDDLRYLERAVDTYVAEPFRALDWQIQQMPEHAETPGASGTPVVGSDEDWQLVADRVGAVPAYASVALENLRAGFADGNAADHRMVDRDGIAGARANADYFNTSLPAVADANLSATADRRRLLDHVIDRSLAAAEAWRGFATALEALPRPDGDRFAVGEAEWEWRVHNNLRDPRSAAEIWAYAAEEVAAYRERLLSVAGEIARERALTARFGTPEEQGDTVSSIIAELGRDAARDDDERLQWHIDCGRRAIDYGREQDLFDIPADYRLEVVPTPPLLRGTMEAAYYPSAPLKPGGVGRFYLTPTGNDPAVLARNGRASVAATAVHEGFPGHDWHYRTMADAGISPLRWLTPGAVEDSSSMWSDSMSIEGWGLYAEELMGTAAAGTRFGFYALEEQFYFLYWGLRRAMRVRVDAGLHTGRMTYDEAIDWWAATQDFMPDARARAATDPAARAVLESADRNIYRYSKWVTQGITYNLGKRSIVALREQYLAANRNATARQFHDWYLRLGTVPAGHLADHT